MTKTQGRHQEQPKKYHGRDDRLFGTFCYPSAHMKLLVRCLIFVHILQVSYSSNSPDVEGEALIELLRSLNDTNGSITDWDDHFVSPCFSWSHVSCRSGNVISLNLASKGFSGTFSPAITKLTYLVTLGAIPASWGRQFSSLKHLGLHSNHLSGSIPDSLANITGLRELDLSSNELIGRLPVQLFSLSTFNYSGNHLFCGSSMHQPCVSSSHISTSSRKSSIPIVILGISSGAFILLLVGFFFAVQYLKRRRLRNDLFFDVAGEDDRKISFGQLRRFSWREMQIATVNFNESNIIGQGGFGKVYKGLLLDGTKVAVKRLTDYHSPGGEAAFLREVQLISVAVHKNLLRLIGFCTTSSERILVYPFMQNLSVAYRLRDLKAGEKGLDWPSRKRVALGAAKGLEYLHENCNPKIIHRDLKAANILLDDDFEAILGDFGLAKLIDTKMTHVTTQVRGTMGHIAPEYLSTGKSSEKTDVFGYGITLLELVTGQRAIDFSRLEEEEDVLLLDHIKKLLREKRLEDIVDNNLDEYNEEEVETMLQVALLCTQSSPEDRPKMTQVVTMMLQGVGLAERWAEWELLEQERERESSLLLHRFEWAEDSMNDQEAIQLSQAR